MNARRGRVLFLARVIVDATRRGPVDRTRWLARSALLWTFLLSIWARADSLTVTVPQGLSTLSNPFNDESNRVSQVLAHVPEGTQLYQFDAAAQRWLVNQFQFGSWVHSEQTLAPGEGAFIRNPAEPFSITFAGTPPTNFVAPVRSGNNLLSVPAGATIQLNPRDDDLLHFWDPTRTNYSPVLIAQQGVWWSPLTGSLVDPPFRPGESFLYYRTPAPGETVPKVQHSVYFNNYAPASGVDAPISSTYGCFGSTWVAQLYQGFGDPGPLDSTNYTAVGEQIPLLASTDVTYVDPQFDGVRFMTPGSISLQIRAWDSRRGGSFEAAVFAGGGIGWSKVFAFSPGPDLQPPLNLVGLGRFDVGPLTPFWTWFPYPTNATVVEGQSARFEVGQVGAQFGTPDYYTYQWQRETAPNTWTDIVGATSRILRIPAVQKADAGRYRAVGRFDCASGVSLPSVLTVFGSPQLSAATASEANQTLLLSGIGSVQIEASFDLSHWADFAAATNGFERWEIRVTNASEFSQRFFRARLAP